MKDERPNALEEKPAGRNRWNFVRFGEWWDNSAMNTNHELFGNDKNINCNNRSVEELSIVMWTNKMAREQWMVCGNKSNLNLERKNCWYRLKNMINLDDRTAQSSETNVLTSLRNLSSRTSYVCIYSLYTEENRPGLDGISALLLPSR